jgi:hypothetical protein
MLSLERNRERNCLVLPSRAILRQIRSSDIHTGEDLSVRSPTLTSAPAWVHFFRHIPSLVPL